MPGFGGDGWRRSDAGDHRWGRFGPFCLSHDPTVRHPRSRHADRSTQLLDGMMAVLFLCGLDVEPAVRLAKLLRYPTHGSETRPDAEALLRRLGARRVGPFDLPLPHALLRSISERAGLPRTPALYWIPTTTMNAFAMGTRDQAAVAVTQGLIQNLTFDELAGILAHEIAHIRNDDDATLELARALTSATEMMSVIRLILLRFEVGGRPRDSRLADASLLLTLAPIVSRLLQLALSRLREFDADLDAIALSGGATGLMCALLKLEQHHTGDGAVARPTGFVGSFAALLRSHPETPARLHSLFQSGLTAVGG
jgi:heat shock protein HtpX